MRRVAGEHDAAMAVVGQGERAGRINARPVQLPRHAAVANHLKLGVDAQAQRLGLQRLLGRFVGRQLVVNTPHVQRLAVHQDGVAGVPRWVEKRQALGGQGQLDADVCNHKTALVGAAFELQVKRAAQGGARAVTGHHKLCALHIAAVGRVNFKGGGIGEIASRSATHRACCAILKHPAGFVPPANLQQWLVRGLLQQGQFDKLLLQIGQRREAVMRALVGFHAKHALAPVKRIAATPRQADFFKHAMRACLLQDLQRAPCEGNGAAAKTHLLL